MEASICSKVNPFSPSLPQSSHLLSVRHFNKHFRRKAFSLKNSLPRRNSMLILTSPNNPFHIGPVTSSLPPSDSRIIRRPIKCSISSSTAPTDSDAPSPLLNSLKSTLSQLTPVDICKWSLAFFVAVTASKWTVTAVNLLLNPFFWTYFSWTWLFWPWMVAIALAIHGVYSLTKYYLNGKASVFEQLSVITSAFTWLTLVPPAHFNGFLEGWPFVFFFAYHYFFFLNISVRKRLYGDCYTREHDAKWDISMPSWQKLLFCIGVVVGHWLAAFEGTELHLVPGGWGNNLGIWGLIMLAVFMQYHSILYLAKYSEKVVVPTSVVQFGPYRFVRHPMYASTMLLFVSYFAALRAPMSALFIVGVCLVYYGEKAKMEEGLMLETFGERYSEYMSKVRYKLIPFVY